jgi:hypothetical protein
MANSEENGTERNARSGFGRSSIGPSRTKDTTRLYSRADQCFLTIRTK